MSFENYRPQKLRAKRPKVKANISPSSVRLLGNYNDPEDLADLREDVKARMKDDRKAGLPKRSPVIQPASKSEPAPSTELPDVAKEDIFPEDDKKDIRSQDKSM